jgi:inner membrane protein
MLHYMPDALEVDGKLMPEVKHRSIFKIVLYKSDVVLKGKIAPLQLAKAGIDPNSIQWNEVRLCLGITDNRGIAE